MSYFNRATNMRHFDSISDGITFNAFVSIRRDINNKIEIFALGGTGYYLMSTKPYMFYMVSTVRVNG